ncbi:DUF664 domain-containing protein [Prauserella muralis]|uniref:Uncharacterized protein n=1 Tax=Prauserella muralis TaxID=588067 RepID=A0A2V4AKH6_9PSEU|nr:DUF664 domain-containing protein [Prauserella muralis]PXY20777.1 hypothetical protein BAY60_24990 [Prauserella muralis]TWE29796.1 uncharacterized protein DUF664 [Prauserella muralis]
MTVDVPRTGARLEADEYLYFVTRAFDGMLAALGTLGDERINDRPPLAGANSPYAIVYHCAEVAEYWIGHVLAGRPSARDRAAEFQATGTLDGLRRQVAEVSDRIRADLAGAGLDAAPANPPSPDYQGPDRPLTCAGVLLHVLEELAQHNGQVELTRDVLRAERSR